MAYTRFGIKGIPFKFKGAINVNDCTSAEDVIIKAGLNWNVAKCPMVAKMPFGDVINAGESPEIGDGFIMDDKYYRECPNAFATYRTDINIPLGIVKERYTEVQNIDAFKFFNNAIGKDKAIWQTAGFFGNGERIFVSAKLPDSITVKNDKIDNYLVFTTSHDGSSGVKILFTPIRVVCENTLNAAIKNTDNYVSFKHTKSVHENIDSAAEILGICKQQTQMLSEEYNALANIKLRDSEVESLFTTLILSPEEQQKIIMYGYKPADVVLKNWNAINAADISTKKANTINMMYQYYFDGPGQKEFLGTAWGAYNAITGYYSNVDNAEGTKRMDSLLYGSKANKIKETADILIDNYQQGIKVNKYLTIN